MNNPNPYPFWLPAAGSPGNRGWAPGMVTAGCCISRRVAGYSGCGSPPRSPPGGKAAAKPSTQRARSRTQLNTPPIGANAPLGSGVSSVQPSGPRAYPRASPAGSNSPASNPVRVIPSGLSSRARTKSG